MRIILLFLISISTFGQPTAFNWRDIDFAAIARETANPPACQFDVTIPATAWYVDKDKNTNTNAYVINPQPGQTVCFAAGTRGVIEFHNINGTASAPITFASCSGTTLKGSGGQHVVAFYNSSFIKFTGEQGPIDLTGGGHGLWFGSLSTNVEASFINFHDLGYSGFEAKTDPTCDPKTWRGQFTLRDVRVHDCTFKNIL